MLYAWDSTVFRCKGNVSAWDSTVFSCSGKISALGSNVFSCRGKISACYSSVFRCRCKISAWDITMYRLSERYQSGSVLCTGGVVRIQNVLVQFSGLTVSYQHRTVLCSVVSVRY